MPACTLVSREVPVSGVASGTLHVSPRIGVLCSCIGYCFSLEGMVHPVVMLLSPRAGGLALQDSGV